MDPEKKLRQNTLKKTKQRNAHPYVWNIGVEEQLTGKAEPKDNWSGKVDRDPFATRNLNSFIIINQLIN